MGVGRCLVRGRAQGLRGATSHSGGNGNKPEDQAISGLQADAGLARAGQGRGLGLLHHPQPPRTPRSSCLEQGLSLR